MKSKFETFPTGNIFSGYAPEGEYVREQVIQNQYDTISFGGIGWDKVKRIDLSYLKDLKSIRDLTIVHDNDTIITGFEALYSLPNLRRINLMWFNDIFQTENNEVFDISQCKNLTEFIGSLHKNIINFEKCERLEHIQIRHFSDENFSRLTLLKNLKKVRFAQFLCKTAKGLENLSNLEEIWLQMGSKLEDVSDVGGCENLKILNIESCRKLKDIQLKSRTLQKAIFLQKIQNINFVKDCPKLEFLQFKELTDGNLQPAIDVKLKEVYFGTKKPNYTHSNKELTAILNELQKK